MAERVSLFSLQASAVQDPQRTIWVWYTMAISQFTVKLPNRLLRYLIELWLSIS